MPARSRIETDLLDAVRRLPTEGSEACHRLLAYGLDLLPVLTKYLAQRLPLEEIEQYERVLKEAVRPILLGPTSGPVARQAASLLRQVGFIVKLKSYAIKAATPLGYSIFFQNDGEGFSFQRHRTLKTELFHILEVQQRSLVFICPYEDWIKIYDPDSLRSWLGGREDSRYDRFAFVPSPGDLFTISRTNIVHTVIGCVLEEFATLSTDWVDRLHDQNQGRSVPSGFARPHAIACLQSLRPQLPRRSVTISPSGITTRDLEERKRSWGTEIDLSPSDPEARTYSLESSASTDRIRDTRFAVTLCCRNGQAEVSICDQTELNGPPPPALRLSAGDVLTIPRDIYYQLSNLSDQAVLISEHRMAVEAALV